MLLNCGTDRARKIPLRSDAGILANGDLTTAPTGIAFDWRLDRGEGFSSTWQPGQLEILLSGAQAESCALLEQIVAIVPARHYALRFEYSTVGLASPTGLVWDLEGETGPAILPATRWETAESLLSRGHTGVGHESQLAKLRLLYRRVPGTVRAEGRIKLGKLYMEAL